jgi:hypothetical protein
MARLRNWTFRRAFSARVSPPKLGGVAATKGKYCEASLAGADGVVPFPKRPKNAFLEITALETTPSAPLRMLREISLVAATPPNLGGDTLTEKPFGAGSS